jgi:hypothetical protein
MDLDTYMKVYCEHRVNDNVCDRQCNHKLIVGSQDVYTCGYHWRECVRHNELKQHFVLNKNNAWTLYNPSLQKNQTTKNKQTKSSNCTNVHHSRKTVIMFNAPVYIQNV